MCFHSCWKADALEGQEEEEEGNRGNGDKESKVSGEEGRGLPFVECLLCARNLTHELSFTPHHYPQENLVLSVLNLEMNKPERVNGLPRGAQLCGTELDIQTTVYPAVCNLWMSSR